MDLRSLIAKMDAIEQQALVQEAEDILTEKVRIRYSDVEAVAKQYPTDEVARGQALAKLAKDNGLPGLFDPVSQELVNPDGSLSTFKGADEATVNQLKQWGLLPLGAKTSSWLGMRGQDQKTAISANQTAQSRDAMVDKAEALMKKGVESAVAAVATESAMFKSGMAESLIKEFGYSHTLLEAITPAEHKELKKLIVDLTPFAKTDPDVTDIVAQFRAYNQQRDQIIARIKELVAAIKAKKPVQKEDLASIAKGADTVVRGAANMITFGYADQAEAWLNSKLKGTKLADELKSSLDRTANDEENSPWLYYGGQVGGALLTAPLTGVKVGLGLAATGVAADTLHRQPGNAEKMAQRTKERQGANPRFDPEVERLQSQLKAMGYNLGKTGPKKDGIDGVLGDKTITAAKAAKLPLPKTAATKKPASTIPASASATIPTATPAAAPAATNATANTTSGPANMGAPAAQAAASPEMAGAIKTIQAGLTSAGVRFDPSGNGWINGVTAFAKSKGISPAEALGQLTSNTRAESLAESFSSLRNRLDAISQSTINEDLFFRPLSWVITKLATSGADDIAKLAATVVTRETPAAERQAINAAKKIAQKIQQAGQGATDDVVKAAVSGADNVAPAVVKGGADDAAKIAADLEYQSWFKTAPAIEKSMAEKFGYRVGKALATARANSKIVRFMTNPMFLLALAALALAGYTISQLGDFEGEGGNPEDSPSTVVPSTVVPSVTEPVAPVEDPEVKLNISELQKLIDRLNGGWPDDAETAAANADAATVGAKVPGGDRAGQGGNPANVPRAGVMSAADMLEKDKATAIR